MKSTSLAPESHGQHGQQSHLQTHDDVGLGVREYPSAGPAAADVRLRHPLRSPAASFCRRLLTPRSSEAEATVSSGDAPSEADATASPCQTGASALTSCVLDAAEKRPPPPQV